MLTGDVRTDRRSSEGFTLPPDLAFVAEAAHLVQFYETDEFLADAVDRFIGAALGAGDAAIVIATPQHRAQLETRLLARGLDLCPARREGRYVPLDAAETLASFMVEGEPDRARFGEVVGGVVAKAAKGGDRRVRAFGEMVALLWAEGKREAAVRLENHWNDLAKTVPFSLLCAYPTAAFARAADSGPLTMVCDTHSHVIPAESYSALDSGDERQRAIAMLQQQANSLKAEVADRTRAEERAVKALAEAQRAREEAQAASLAKDEFLSVVSHELRTPLASILGWVGVLRTLTLDERAVRAVETIERSGRVQAKLIEDLLDVSRITSGQMRLDLRLVELPSIVRSVVDAIRPTADAKGVGLEARLDPAAGPVAGDCDRLQQITWNLLSNAVKFTPRGGLVEVCLERREEDLRLTVRDTGRGIAPDFLPLVFEHFRQADQVASRRTGGLGLGLAIVRNLVELHGGTVAVASSGEGQGATFTVSFPLTLPPDETRARP